MTEFSPLDWSERLKAARTNLESIEPISSTHPLSEESAYEIQMLDLKDRERNGQVQVGVKLGLTSWAKQEQMKVDKPVVGFLTERMRVGESITRSNYAQPRIEPELVFRTSREITREISLQEVRGFVDGIAAGFEILDSRYPKFSFTFEDVIADNTSAASFGISTFMPLPEEISSLEAHIREDGKNERFGILRDILGDPLQAVTFLSRHIEKYGLRLPAGSIVLAGSVTDALVVHAGSTYEIEIDGLPSIQVKAI